MACLASVVPHNVGKADHLALFGVPGLLDGVDVNDIVLPRAARRLPVVLNATLLSFARAGGDRSFGGNLWRGEFALLAMALWWGGFRAALLGFLSLGLRFGRAATDLLEISLEHVRSRLSMW